MHFGPDLSFNHPRMDAHRFSPRFWSVLVLTFVVAAFVAHGSPAVAQEASPEVLTKVTKLNKKALDAYQKRDFETARNVLKEALELCTSSGLDNHPIKARTHIHLGVVMIAGFKQRDSGIKHFKKALQIQPDIQLTKSLVTPALQDAFEEAMVAQGAGGGDDTQGNAAQSDNDQGTPGPSRDSADGDESSTPRRRPIAGKKKKKKHDDEEDGDGDGDGGAVTKKHGDDDDDEDDAVGMNNAGKIFVGLTLGGGFGIASGTGEMSSTVKHTLASAGFAPAQLLHIAPEVGYFINSNLLLSLQGRYQIVTGLNAGSTTCGTTACSSKTSAIAVFARATYIMMPTGDLHVFVGGSVGGGAIRHVSNFPQDRSCGTTAQGQTCVDTLQAGPFLIGPNVGIIYDLGKTASLIVALNTQLGVPKFTFNLDANAGVGLKF